MVSVESLGSGSCACLMRVKHPKRTVRDSGWDQVWHVQTKDHQRANIWGHFDLFSADK